MSRKCADWLGDGLYRDWLYGLDFMRLYSLTSLRLMPGVNGNAEMSSRAYNCTQSMMWLVERAGPVAHKIYVHVAALRLWCLFLSGFMLPLAP